MTRFSVAAVSAALLLATTPAIAGTVFIEQTADLAGLAVGNGSARLDEEDFSAVNVQIAEGDVVDWTVRFQAGQSLTLTDPSAIHMILIPQIGLFNYLTLKDTAQLQLLDENDGVVADYTVDLDGVITGAVNGIFSKTFPVPQAIFGSPVTFSGLRAVVGVGEYFIIPQTVLTFDSANILFVDPSFVGTGAVPEPATWAMLILGFGMAGSLIRRRRALATA